MNEKGANIDLLFRNGLKDYEVLPPSDVWDNIHPVIKINSKPIILLRIAAVITLLLTLSFLTYRWNREISKSTSESVVAFNIKTSSPIFSNNAAKRLYIPEEFSQVKNSSDISIETASNDYAFKEIEPAISSQQLFVAQQTENLSIINFETTRGTLPPHLVISGSIQLILNIRIFNILLRIPL